MPVRKFRSVEEMEGNVRYEPGSPELFRAIRALWEFSARIFPRRFPPGVYKHRSIEDARSQRDVWEEADFRALWESRGVKPEQIEEKLKAQRPG
jgi:hypothetical protein